MEKKWVVTGLILIITAIILGAFGAHGLRTVIENNTSFNELDGRRIVESFETGTKYQFLNGLGFLIIPLWIKNFALKDKSIFWLLLIGVLLFSGSIYGLTVAKLNKIDTLKRILGPTTPLGGLMMILSWTILLIQVLRIKKA